MFAEMTWPEVKEVIKEQRIAVVPVAIIEEHGYHLPVDTDLILVSEVCAKTGRKIPGEIVVISPVNHGYAPHQMDFPGVISISEGEGRPVIMIPYWSCISETGTLGDPTTATKEKGRQLLAAAVEGLIEFISVFKSRKHCSRISHLP